MIKNRLIYRNLIVELVDEETLSKLVDSGEAIVKTSEMPSGLTSYTYHYKPKDEGKQV